MNKNITLNNIDNSNFPQHQDTSKKIKKYKIKSNKKHDSNKKDVKNNENMIIQKKEVQKLEDVIFTPSSLKENTLLDAEMKLKRNLVLNQDLI